jgi:hypothetical protein
LGLPPALSTVVRIVGARACPAGCRARCHSLFWRNHVSLEITLADLNHEKVHRVIGDVTNTTDFSGDGTGGLSPRASYSSDSRNIVLAGFDDDGILDLAATVVAHLRLAPPLGLSTLNVRPGHYR